MRVCSFVPVVIFSHNQEKNISDFLGSLLLLEYPKTIYETIQVDNSTS